MNDEPVKEMPKRWHEFLNFHIIARPGTWENWFPLWRELRKRKGVEPGEFLWSKQLYEKFEWPRKDYEKSE